MYIILGEEQIALTLWYWRGVITLVMYPIIIADIAPYIPGGLTHFNWPRSLCDKPLYRVYHEDLPYNGYNTCEDGYNGKTENEKFSLGSIMLLK